MCSIEAKKGYWLLRAGEVGEVGVVGVEMVSPSAWTRDDCRVWLCKEQEENRGTSFRTLI